MSRLPTDTVVIGFTGTGAAAGQVTNSTRAAGWRLAVRLPIDFDRELLASFLSGMLLRVPVADIDL